MQSATTTQREDTFQQQLDDLLGRFYAVISFAEGEAPDWIGMERIFSKHARITRVTPEGIDYMDLTGFRAMAEELLELGAFTGLFEHEVARRTDVYGDVIHVASAYVTKISPRALDYIERGVNSLQLVREGGQWRILSLCWDDHASFNLSGMQSVTKG